MFKAIVIDDKLVARETIKKYCKVYAADFEIWGSFSNGFSALEYLAENDVDVVFTDIKMSDISGLDIAKWIAENKPYTKVVMVSGYSEFEYAHQAIRYKVFDYLLKVIKPDEFQTVIEKLRIALSEDSSVEKTLELELFFFNVLCGMYSDENDMKKAFAECSYIPYDEAICKIIRVQFRDFSNFISQKKIVRQNGL